MKVFQQFLFISSVFASLTGMSYPQTVDHESEAREFVEQCLKDPTVFVVNPPADRNPYRDLSMEEIIAASEGRNRRPSRLLLYLSGLPGKFETWKDFKEDGTWKTWYPDGRVQAVETFSEGKLLAGKYYGEEGELVSEVVDGNGERSVLVHPADRQPTSSLSVTRYKNGTQVGAVRQSAAEVLEQVRAVVERLPKVMSE